MLDSKNLVVNATTVRWASTDNSTHVGESQMTVFSAQANNRVYKIT
jgi:hypothetical protein